MAEKISNQTPLERWYQANRNDPDLDMSLRLLLGHALVGVFRHFFPDSSVFSPEKALSLVQRLPKKAFPEGMGYWISSPGRNASEILRFCEGSARYTLPSDIDVRGLSEGAVDLRGVRCPLGSVRARLVMLGLEAGDEVSLFVDDGEPIENVPRALVEEGDQILFREKKEDYWEIRVRKRGTTK